MLIYKCSWITCSILELVPLYQSNDILQYLYVLNIYIYILQLKQPRFSAHSSQLYK